MWCEKCIYACEAYMSVLAIVAAPEIFLGIFLKKHKLYNLIKKEIHILKITTIKKNL